MPADPEPMYELTRDQLATQLSFVDALDTKIGLFLSVGSGLVGILAAVLALHPSSIGHPDFRALVACVGAYILVAGAGGFGLWSRAWGLGPDPRVVAKDYNKTSGDAVRRRMAAKFNQDYEANLTAYRHKLWALRLTLVGLVIETLALVAALASLAA